MKIVRFIIACFFPLSLLANNDKQVNVLSYEQLNNVVIIVNNDNLELLDNYNIENNLKPNPVFALFKKKQRLNKKITAAALAFPFPFGIVGLHRIYLGTKPYVPIAYIGTVGGVFGILPLIDFCKITFDKDLTRYQNNGKVFMWIED